MVREVITGLRSGEVWPAAGFVVAAATEAAIRHSSEPAVLASNVIGSLTFACLALRRRRPLLTVSIMTSVFVIASVVQAVLTPHGSGDAVVPIFALLVASYSLGAYGDRHALRWGAWQPFVLVMIVDISQQSAYSLLGAALFILIFVSAAPIVAGRLVRGRTTLVRRLRDQAAEIEAQRELQIDAVVTAERLRMAEHFHGALLAGMRLLVARAAAGSEANLPEIERDAQRLLAQTREEVVALTSPVDPPVGPAPVSQVQIDFRDVAQPWTVLAAGALCAALLAESRTLHLAVPLGVAVLACVGVAVPLTIAWARPVLATAALWTLVTLFDRFVAPLDGSFTAIGLAFVPPFLVAALTSRRRAMLGLAICLAGEAATFGVHGLVDNGAVVMCCWIAGLILYERASLVERLRANNAVLEAQRDVAARHAVEAERLHVARDLHDSAGHSLTVIALQAGAARRIAASDPRRAAEVLQTIAQVARDGLAELQAGSAPGATNEEVRTIEDLLAAAREAGLHIDVDIEDVDALLAPNSRLAVYRVVQESLTNVLKHAPGARTALSIKATGPFVEVVVTNGASARPSGAVNGGQQGLRGMRDRVAACGGRLQWSRQTDGAFELRAQLPATALAT